MADDAPTTSSRFSVRFVLAVFGGAALGLVVGVLGTWLFDASWNEFAVMSWGIMAGAIALTFRSAAPVVAPRAGRGGDPDLHS